MEPIEQRIELLRVVDNTSVPAMIVRLTRSLAQAKIDGIWWKDLGLSAVQRKKENDHAWQWAKRIGQLRNARWHEAVAVQTEDENVQGAILYRIDTNSFIEQDQGAIHGEALSTAPRNRPWLVPSPQYRGVGEKLLLRAVSHSYSLGLEGRVNFAAFDDPRTMTFYQNRGFKLVGHDDEGLPQFELPPDAAKAWLRDEGYDL
jgi:GNAT superfamily N-acetyltransferase